MTTLKNLMEERAQHKTELINFVNANHPSMLDFASNLYLLSVAVDDAVNKPVVNTAESGHFSSFNTAMFHAKEMVDGWATPEQKKELNRVADYYFDFSNAVYQVHYDETENTKSGSSAQGLVYLMMLCFNYKGISCANIKIKPEYQQFTIATIIQKILGSGLLEVLEALSPSHKIGEEDSEPETGITLKVARRKGFLLYVNVPNKSDIDKINSAFDCYQNPALPDEAILDCSTVEESDLQHELAIEIFGKAQFEKIAGFMVVFHP